jgi:hypothetical protein
MSLKIQMVMEPLTVLEVFFNLPRDVSFLFAATHGILSALQWDDLGTSACSRVYRNDIEGRSSPPPAEIDGTREAAARDSKPRDTPASFVARNLPYDFGTRYACQCPPASAVSAVHSTRPSPPPP